MTKEDREEKRKKEHKEMIGKIEALHQKGYTNVEIGKILGIGEAAVRTRMHFG